MVRPSIPLPPRVMPPDLPSELEPATLGVHESAFGALIAGLAGIVDASHSRLTEGIIRDADVESLQLDGAAFTDVDIEGLRAVLVSLRSARWHTVRVTGGRIATLDLSRSQLTGVEFRGVRIDYLTLAGATASDVQFTDCTIGTLDAPQAVLNRVAFEGCRADEVDNRGWRVEHLDLRGLEALAYVDPIALRGATLAARQVEQLAPAFARALGVDVREDAR